MEFRVINYTTAVTFLLPRHYSGRKPPIKWAFGWYDGSRLMAVCTFGKPASNTLCDGICGKSNSKHVYELNRLCREDDLTEQLSKFVAQCLRWLKPLNVIIVSYSDTAMNHHGYIYQACNFLYTGVTRKRTEKWTPGNKHSRHYDNSQQGEFRKVRYSKHRYVYFCTNSKKQKREWVNALRYTIQRYPKGDNDNYVLGTFLQPTLVRRELMYECFHCGADAVIWDSDFSFEDCGYDGEGIVHFCHCTHCGAQIEYRISLEEDDGNKESSDEEHSNQVRCT